MWQSWFQPPPHQTLKYAGYHLNILSSWWILYETSVFEFRGKIVEVSHQLHKRRLAWMKTSGMWRMSEVKRVRSGSYWFAVALLLFHLLHCVPALWWGGSDCIDHAWMQLWWKPVLIIAFHYALSSLWHLAFHCRETEKFWFSEVLWLSFILFF